MTKSTPWTDAENVAVCALYFAMLDSASAGTPYNKAKMLCVAQGGIGPRDLSETINHATPYVGLLNLRSKGSIEAKLMNCTAAHRDISAASGGRAITMDGYGYRALSNYQASLKVAMADALKARELRQSA